MHSEKTLPLLPLLRSRPPQIIANDLSIVNIFRIRHSGSQLQLFPEESMVCAKLTSDGPTHEITN